MKNLFLLFALTVTSQLFAGDKVLEFDETQERKCHQELQALGCVNESGEQVMTCARQKRTKMTKECEKIHDQQTAN